MANFRGARRSFSRVAGKRRAVYWGSSALTAPITVAANSDVLVQIFSSAALASAFEDTIVRIRGAILIASDQSATTESPVVFWGIKLQNQRAVTAGILSCPRPFDEPDQDWLGYGVDIPGPTVAATTGGYNRPDRQVDFKSMRKLHDEDALIMVLNNLSGSAGAQVDFGFHVLFKEG